MRAHLVLKKAAPTPGIEDALPTAATIKNYLASPETVRKAESAAQQLGFKVVDATPLQVTIEGPKGKFEKVFSSRLKSAGTKKVRAKEKKRLAAKKPAVQETPTRSPQWTWLTPPALPAEMDEVVAEVVLPQATALH